MLPRGLNKWVSVQQGDRGHTASHTHVLVTFYSTSFLPDHKDAFRRHTGRASALGQSLAWVLDTQRPDHSKQEDMPSLSGHLENRKRTHRKIKVCVILAPRGSPDSGMRKFIWTQRVISC